MPRRNRRTNATLLLSDVRGSADRAYRVPCLEALEERITPSLTPLGIEQLVNTIVVGDQRSPVVGAHPNSNQYVIVWTSAGEDGSGEGIYAQRYDRYGSQIGSPFRVNTFTTGNQTAPAAAMDALGSFVVWQSSGQDGSGDGVYARRYGYDAVPLGGEFRVNSAASGSQQAPAIAMDDDGDFVITFQSTNRDNSGLAVMARVYRSNGASDFLFGGDGNDLIQTGAGNDIADSGAGHDILLGGDGAEGASDTLVGGAGNDILVGDGGATSYRKKVGGADLLSGGLGQDLILAGFLIPPDDLAPAAILAEWTSGRSYAERIDNITGAGVGPRNNGDYFLTAGTVVFNNRQTDDPHLVIDQVLGADDVDWLWLDIVHDTSDAETGEVVVDVSVHPLT